jgi:hypothetical protein
VTVLAKPTANLTPATATTAEGTNSPQGNAVTLASACTNSTSATLKGDDGTSYSVAATNDTTSVSPSWASGTGNNVTTYTLTCTGSGGSATDTSKVTVTPLPDLTATALTPTSVVGGSSVKFSSTIQNTGDASTGSAFPVFYQKATSASGAGATSMGTDSSAAAVAANGSGSSIMDSGYTVPSTNFWVRACANTTNNTTFSVTESNTGNNCSPWTAVSVIAPLSATCSPSDTSISVGDNEIWTANRSGGTGTYSYSWSGTNSISGNTQTETDLYSTTGTKTATVVVTSGTQSVSATCSGSTGVTVYALPNATLSASPTTVSPSVPNSNLSSTCASSVSGSINGGVGSVNIPSDTNTVSPSSTTTYTLTCTNAAGATDTDTATVSYVGQPDLTVTGAISPTSAVAGTATKFAATVKNQGNASTGVAFPVLYQVATSAAGAGATSMGTDSSALALAASASETSTMDSGYTFASSGTYYVRACANTTNNSTFSPVVESSTSNNCGSWTAVSVSAAPIADLIASSSPVPTTATVGTPVKFAATVKNQGTGATTGAFPDLFQVGTGMSGGNLTGTVTNVGTDSSAPSLAAGTSETSTMDTPSAGYTFASAGTYYVRMCVNTTNNSTFSVAESSTANNCGTPVAIIVSPIPTPTASCGVSPTSGPVRTTYTWNAVASGGSGTGYTYAWTGVGGLTGKTGAAPSVTYTTAGTYTGAVTVTDSAGQSSGAVSCSTGGGGTGTGASTVVTSPVSITNFSPTSSTGTIVCGSNAYLIWSTTGATSCTGTGFSTGGATNNSTGVAVSPTTQSNYELSCSDSLGDPAVYANTTVNVTTPSATVAVSPVRVASGGQVTVTWSAQHVKSCSVTANGAAIPGASGNADANGNFSIGSPYTAKSVTSQTEYVITCTVPAGVPVACTNGANGTATASATTNIIPTIQNF